MRPAHKLVKVARKLVLMAATHSLELDFDLIPVGLDILGVDPMAVARFTNSRQWLTTPWLLTFGRLPTLLYAPHSSDHTIEPFAS